MILCAKPFDFFGLIFFFANFRANWLCALSARDPPVHLYTTSDIGTGLYSAVASRRSHARLIDVGSDVNLAVCSILVLDRRRYFRVSFPVWGVAPKSFMIITQGFSDCDSCLDPLDV